MDRLLNAVLARIVKTGALTVIGASGSRLTHGDRSGTPVTVRFTSSLWQIAVIFDSELRLGEAYMNGGLIVEEGSIADFLDILVKNTAQTQPTFWNGALRRFRSFCRRWFSANTQWRSRHNATYHYNIDYRIYKLFLDSDMQYSCAYFESPGDSIDLAQAAKKQHIAVKLLLEPRLNILDIGSGWGGLALYLSRTFGVSVIGITLSDEQAKIAKQRAVAAAAPCEFRIQDYRKVSEKFDRIVSVGMFEHVGKRNYDTFFKKCGDILADDGVLLLHTIGRWNGPSDTNAWVWRYIFPGGYTPALSELTPAIERSGLIIGDIEVLHLHYAKTLRAWRFNFLAKQKEVVKLFEEDLSLKGRFGTAERFIRMWEYYLAGFEAAFQYSGLSVFQIQLVKNLSSLPSTREYLYRPNHHPREGELARAAE
jgi:cyclopropane-fatty-acyl-phospholipid synthase